MFDFWKEATWYQKRWIVFTWTWVALWILLSLYFEIPAVASIIGVFMLIIWLILLFIINLMVVFGMLRDQPAEKKEIYFDPLDTIKIN